MKIQAKTSVHEGDIEVLIGLHVTSKTSVKILQQSKKYTCSLFQVSGTEPIKPSEFPGWLECLLLDLAWVYDKELTHSRNLDSFRMVTIEFNYLIKDWKFQSHHLIIQESGDGAPSPMVNDLTNHTSVTKYVKKTLSEDLLGGMTLYCEHSEILGWCCS